MTIAFDAVTVGGGSSEPSPYDFNHTPVGTPKGVIVLIFEAPGNGGVSGVTYGGVTMTQVTLSPLVKSSGEACNLSVWFLGSGVPAGVQTVAASHSGGFHSGYCITLTALRDTSVQDTTTISNDSLENPSATLSLGGFICFCAEILFSGHGDIANISPLANWTNRNEQDLGLNALALYSYDIIDVTDVTMGWTQTAEDAAAIGVAVLELPFTPSFGKIIG